MLNVLSKVKNFFFPKKLPSYVTLKKDASLNVNSQIGAALTIEEGTRIKNALIVKGSGNVTIGKYCAFGRNIRIQLSSHSMNYANMNEHFQKKFGFNSIMKKYDSSDVKIGNAVWVADDVYILPGVTIGDGAVLAAGTIVTKDVEPFSVVAGIPGKRIKYRFKTSIIEELQSICWWDWSDEKMKRNKVFFEKDLTTVETILDKVNE